MEQENKDNDLNDEIYNDDDVDAIDNNEKNNNINEI